MTKKKKRIKSMEAVGCLCVCVLCLYTFNLIVLPCLALFSFSCRNLLFHTAFLFFASGVLIYKSQWVYYRGFGYLTQRKQHSLSFFHLTAACLVLVTRRKGNNIIFLSSHHRILSFGYPSQRKQHNLPFISPQHPYTLFLLHLRAWWYELRREFYWQRFPAQ